MSEDKTTEQEEAKADENTPAAIEPAPQEKAPKKKLSGAYWYVDTDEAELAKATFNRTLVTVIAFLLQAVPLVMPQGCVEYVTKNIPSYAFVYMWAVFVMIAVSVYTIIMNVTRYKLAKRIPVERAPKNGFKRRSFFGAELFMAVHAVLFVIQFSFVCISFDGFGLASLFISAVAVAAAVWGRMMTVFALRGAERIEPPESEE